MRKKLVKILSVVLALSIVLSLAACGGNKEKAPDAGTAQAEAATQEVTVEQGGTSPLPIVQDKLTLKFVCYNWGDAAYGNDMPVFQELEKRTNIHLDWQLLPAEDNMTKLDLIMASGDLPDLISFSDPENSKKKFDKYSVQGALVPLDELIEKFAPNIKALFSNPPYEVPNLKAESKGPDGKIYSLPTLAEVRTGEIFAIRQDWLDKVGMKTPETSEELYNVLKAFKENDVNGNNEKDEIPLAFDNGMDDVSILMNAFGAHEKFYADQKDGTIKYGPMEEAYKAGLEYCKKLYDDGLLDKDYITKNNTENFRAKISKDLVGMFYAWPMSGLGFGNTAVGKLGEDKKYVAMLPVKGPNGDRFKERPQAAMTPRTVITAANKHQEETIKYLDYIYSEEGNILMNYGIEGKDYTIDSNGKPVFTDYVLKNPDGKDPATVRIEEGMQVGLPFISTLECESQAATDNAVKEAWQLYTEGNVLYPSFPNLPLDETQISEIAGKITDISTFVEENANKFIMGKQPLSDFGKFVDSIKGMGMEEILNTYNEAYKKYAEFNQ